MFRCHSRSRGLRARHTREELNLLLYNRLLGHHYLSKLLDYTLKRAWFEAPANWDLAVFGF